MNVTNYNLVIPCKLGLESILRDEIKALGYSPLVLNGEIQLQGNDDCIARCNLWLRTAERVLIKMAEFPATSFDELFENLYDIPWYEWLPQNAKIDILSKGILSQLHSLRSIQSIGKKAIVENLKKNYKVSWLPEDGPEFKIHVEIKKDQAIIYLNTSGDGLYKRGYRHEGGAAPLRETIAAGLVLLSGWKGQKTFYDPFCGSGTIAIEAALIAAGIAPGINRSFAAEFWPWFDQKVWQEARTSAVETHCNASLRQMSIHASDKDEKILKGARENAKRAGVGTYIHFQRLEVKDFKAKEEKGIVICNPPYGERLGDEKEVEEIYGTIGQTFPLQKGWSYFILSPHPDFERIFGRKAKKNRKIFNGKIKCYFYEF